MKSLTAAARVKLQAVESIQQAAKRAEELQAKAMVAISVPPRRSTGAPSNARMLQPPLPPQPSGCSASGASSSNLVTGRILPQLESGAEAPAPADALDLLREFADQNADGDTDKVKPFAISDDEADVVEPIKHASSSTPTTTGTDAGTGGATQATKDVEMEKEAETEDSSDSTKQQPRKARRVLVSRAFTVPAQLIRSSTASVLAWRPPPPARIKDNVKTFFITFIAGFRSDHTLISFLSPAEDDEALNEMQVVQLFWFVLMLDLYVNCFQYGGLSTGDDYAPIDPINDIINAFVGAIFVVVGVMVGRAIFRWGNTRKIPEGPSLQAKIYRLVLRPVNLVFNMQKRAKKRQAKRERERGKALGEDVSESRPSTAEAPAQAEPLDGVKRAASPPPSPPASGRLRNSFTLRCRILPPSRPTHQTNTMTSAEKASLASALRLDRAQKESRSTLHERLVTVSKAPGDPTGIGLQGIEGRLQVSYVNDDSILAGLLQVNEEIISINDKAVNGDSQEAKQHAASLLRGASDLRLLVRKARMQSLASEEEPMPLVIRRPNPEESNDTEDNPSRWTKWQSAVKFKGRSKTAPALAGNATVASPKPLRKRNSSLVMVAAAKPISTLANIGKVNQEVRDKLREHNLRSDLVYNCRQTIAWTLNFAAYGFFTLNVIIYSGLFGPDATFDLISSWLMGLVFAMGVIEPLNIFAVAAIPMFFGEDSRIYKCYMKCFEYYNEVYG